MQLINQSNKEENLHVWLRCYYQKDRIQWENEGQFYYNIEINNWHLPNIIQCIWLKDARQCDIVSGRLKKQLQNKLLVVILRL